MDATTVFRGSNNPNLTPKCDQPNDPFKAAKVDMRNISNPINFPFWMCLTIESVLQISTSFLPHIPVTGSS